MFLQEKSMIIALDYCIEAQCMGNRAKALSDQSRRNGSKGLCIDDSYRMCRMKMQRGAIARPALLLVVRFTSLH